MYEARSEVVVYLKVGADTTVEEARETILNKLYDAGLDVLICSLDTTTIAEVP